MKSYTDLEQSKALAKILPIESADMYYMETSCNNYTIGVLRRMEKDMLIKQAEYYKMFPCWSLAALLDVLPFPSLHKTFSGWRCDSYNKEGTSCILGEPSNSHVDTCVETIFNLVCCGYDFRKTDGTLPSRAAR